MFACVCCAVESSSQEINDRRFSFNLWPMAISGRVVVSIVLKGISRKLTFAMYTRFDVASSVHLHFESQAVPGVGLPAIRRMRAVPCRWYVANFAQGRSVDMVTLHVCLVDFEQSAFLSLPKMWMWYVLGTSITNLFLASLCHLKWYRMAFGR